MRFKTAKSKFLFFILFSFCFLVLGAGNTFSEGPEVHLIQLDDASINPVTAEYIVNSIETAEDAGAECLIIELDTPGGLLTSTRLIVKEILTADIPVVVYIAPDGSRAGSAGVFITYASHVAAMAPSTNIGAAHPVQIGQQRQKKQNFWEGLGEDDDDEDDDGDDDDGDDDEAEEKRDRSKGPKEGKKVKKKDGGEKDEQEKKIEPDSDPLSSKILNDTVAFIKALAKKRNRNEEWAVKSVTESDSITASEALEKGVVEIIAKSEFDLLQQLDQRIIEVDEETVTLKTKDATIKRIPMDFRQRFFNVLANPNIAYILMILGFYGLLYEITHPGIGVPGILGTIFLILAFFSLQTLPTNYAGLALVILGLLLFIAEAMAPGIGLLALGGLVSLVLGSLLLFDSSTPMMQVSRSLIFGFALPMAAVSLFILRVAIRAHKKTALGGESGMVGEKGEARSNISPEKGGLVFVHGEIWNVTSDEQIKKNEKIVVTEVDGMTLKVKKFTKGE